MHLVEVTHHPDAATRAAVTQFVDEVTDVAGRRPLSDHLWLDLRSPASAPLVVTVRDEGTMLGLAQISAANETSLLEVVVRTSLESARSNRVHDDLVETAVDAYRGAGGGELSWWVDEPGPDAHELARRLDLSPGRVLYEMRRRLPTGQHAEVVTRPFDVDTDADAWLAVNNRAFANHGEQGGWSRAALDARIAEPWFDPDGFRIHERDGRLAAFCWTKLHHEPDGTGVGDNTVGEIYVIAVDPDFHGLGLGKQLSLAGLDSIADRGVTIANLYVDADNDAAIGLYDRLGFTIHRTRQVFGGTQPGTL